MNELEERLIDDLRQATEAVEPQVDVDFLIAAGRRVRRQRVVRRAAGGTAAALMLGLLAWSALGPRVITGIPEPAQTVSTAPADTEAVTVDLTEGYTVNEDEPPYEKLEVAATRSGAGYSVTFVAIRDGVPDASSGWVADGQVIIHQIPRLVAGVVAGQVDWRETVYGRQDGSLIAREVWMPRLGITVLVDVLDNVESAAEGVIWQDADGVVRDDRGREMPSARIGLSGGDHIVYLDDRLGVLGHRAAGSDDSVSIIELGADSEIVKVDSRSRSDGGAWDATAVGVLPDGGGDLEVTLAEFGREWASAKLDGNGRVVFVAVGELEVDDSSDLITAVSYTDSDGKRVTVTAP